MTTTGAGSRCSPTSVTATDPRATTTSTVITRAGTARRVVMHQSYPGAAVRRAGHPQAATDDTGACRPAAPCCSGAVGVTAVGRRRAGCRCLRGRAARATAAPGRPRAERRGGDGARRRARPRRGGLVRLRAPRRARDRLHDRDAPRRLGAPAGRRGPARPRQRPPVAGGAEVPDRAVPRGPRRARRRAVRGRHGRRRPVVLARAPGRRGRRRDGGRRVPADAGRARAPGRAERPDRPARLVDGRVRRAAARRAPRGRPGGRRRRGQPGHVVRPGRRVEVGLPRRRGVRGVHGPGPPGRPGRDPGPGRLRHRRPVLPSRRGLRRRLPRRRRRDEHLRAGRARPRLLAPDAARRAGVPGRRE